MESRIKKTSIHNEIIKFKQRGQYGLPKQMGESGYAARTAPFAGLFWLQIWVFLTQLHSRGVNLGQNDPVYQLKEP